MDGGGEDADGLCRSVLGVNRNPFNGIEGGVDAIDDFCKNGVFGIEMLLLVVCDEKL